MVAQRLGCPTQLVLAVGTELVEELISLTGKTWLTKEDVHELGGCGINRRKAAIYRVLDLQDEDSPLYKKICYMGQLNSERVAAYLLETVQREGDTSHYETPNLGMQLGEKLRAVGF